MDAERAARKWLHEQLVWERRLAQLRLAHERSSAPDAEVEAHGGSDERRAA
jgi:hypothetical protein